MTPSLHNLLRLDRLDPFWQPKYKIQRQPFFQWNKTPDQTAAGSHCLQYSQVHQQTYDSKGAINTNKDAYVL